MSKTIRVVCQEGPDGWECRVPALGNERFLAPFTGGLYAEGDGRELLTPALYSAEHSAWAARWLVRRWLHDTEQGRQHV